MADIIVFGAGGRAGRAVVAEAPRRNARVTAVVRDVDAHADLDAPGVRLAAGDVTDAEQVARLGAGHGAAVSTVARLDVPAERFYTETTTALIDGLTGAGIDRLVVMGIGTTLLTPDGRPAHDADGFDPAARAFSRGHLAGLRLLESRAAHLSWLVLAPPLVFLDEADGGGPVLLGDRTVPAPSTVAASFSYPEAASAVLDEIRTPTRHRALVSIARARSSG